MILIDTALEDRQRQGNPVRVGLVGAGFFGRAVVLQIQTVVQGMRVAAIGARRVEQAISAYELAGDSPELAGPGNGELESAIAEGRSIVVDDPLRIAQAVGIDVIVDATGDAELGARVALEAIRHGKHVVVANAELDSAVGPILKVHADRAGVVYTNIDGDEPGVAMNLYRFVQSIGCRPVMMGQIKGFLDRYRTPATQKEFAEKHGQKPAMVTSFADGSKLAIESAAMGNATGFVPAVRGMRGRQLTSIKDILQFYSPADFAKGGLVEYALGAEPHSGAFVVGFNDDPTKMAYMKYMKMGDGPLYLFYVPFHLPHASLPHTVARAALFRDATLTPRGAPVCSTVTTAKRDLGAGEVLDGMGGFTCYGLVERHDICAAAGYLPIPLSGGCRLKGPIAKDQPISYRDVELPPGRVCDSLWAEQSRHFAS